MKKIFLIVFLIVVSCKNETKDSLKTVNQEDVLDTEEIKELNVVINFKTSKEDQFILSVKNIIIDEYQKKNVEVIENVFPTSTNDQIKANFGENNISNSVRFDLGKKEVKLIQIESINFTYGINSLTVQASELSDYFIINKFVDYDTISYKLQTQEVDGKHYPAIALKRKAINNLTRE